MAKPFKGTIDVDIRDSEPDWLPFEPPVAPYGAPNVVYIVLGTRFGGQLGAFAIAGSGLCVGQDPGEPITEDYPGAPPYLFTGGVIDRVAIDVSGEPYHDLEREAALMLMRE